MLVLGLVVAAAAYGAGTLRFVVGPAADKASSPQSAALPHPRHRLQILWELRVARPVPRIVTRGEPWT